MRRVRLLFPLIGVLALLAVASFLLVSTAAGQPRGDAAAGAAFWSGQLCSRCHGVEGEGAFGPDLAGRGLTFYQFKRELRQPWGIMPAFTERQVSDQNIADLVAYFGTLRPVTEPGPWRTAIPANAPLGQQLLIGYGCGQCHGATMDSPRRALGQEGETDFDDFEELVYEHTEEFPTGRMGNFSELRLPEEALQVIWNYLGKTLGWRVPVVVTVTASAPVGGKATYSITLQNNGALDAGQVFIAALIPPGSTFVGATATPAGAWFRGVEGGAPGVPLSAVWLANRIPAKGTLGPFTFEVSGPGAATGSYGWVRWLSPTNGGDVAMSALTVYSPR
ncbi:MAG: c-type cytochrome [Chloroflexi bacterium]|nr:c-type cytochrome [Chloroflexota bacterium]